ncbi:septation protein SepH [Serinibacter salmoneus]|uniref:DUF3071 domain-containing protein n=1 Tax=Serinibacter salmoneus TaxID=556530 RepID=A0A2A9D0R5_9MICO|nr:septation protein SepH [Serinibacter salmoneus]PFG19542.1 Protein of unknown function (DUF3071) [Serinibacter salmoneus]
MRELRFESLHPDGEYIVLRDDTGEPYRVVIDEGLRLAVRRDRPQLEAHRAAERSSLTPKEIQARIRAGATVEEVAEAGGLSPESVRRFEGPVQAERSWIAQQTQTFTLGRDLGAPTLGDLVLDRLAARGVDSTPQWDAVREGGQPWEVTVRFAAGDQPREARWRVDLVARTLVALDDESRWLSETELPSRHHPYDVEGARGHVGAATIAPTRPAARPTPAGPAVTPAPTTTPAPAEPAASAASAVTDALLADLADRRGRPRREEPEGTTTTPPQDTDPAPTAGEGSETGSAGESSGPDQAIGGGSPLDDALFPAAPVLHLRTSRDAGEGTHPEPADGDAAPDAAPHDPAPTGSDSAEAETTDAAPRSNRRGARARSRRTSVPSWDEIVFGARSEER